MNDGQCLHELESFQHTGKTQAWATDSGDGQAQDVGDLGATWHSTPPGCDLGQDGSPHWGTFSLLESNSGLELSCVETL